MKALPIFGTIRCSLLFVCLLLLLACAVPIQLHAQQPSVSTDGANFNGDEQLYGSASARGGGNLYGWFEWGTTTAYGNVTPQVSLPYITPYYQGSFSYDMQVILQPNTVYHFRAVASNSYATVYGADATFITKGPPVITNQPQSQAVAIGSKATFTVGAWASDSILFYQWQKNGVDIPSATTSSFTITNAQSSDAGTYSVYVSSDWGGMYPVFSSPASLKVGPVLQISYTNGMLVFSWPVYTPGYNLVTATDLNSTIWTSVDGTMVTNGNTVTVTLPIFSDTQRFFRLRSP